MVKVVYRHTFTSKTLSSLSRCESHSFQNFWRWSFNPCLLAAISMQYLDISGTHSICKTNKCIADSLIVELKTFQLICGQKNDSYFALNILRNAYLNIICIRRLETMMCKWCRSAFECVLKHPGGLETGHVFNLSRLYLWWPSDLCTARVRFSTAIGGRRSRESHLYTFPNFCAHKEFGNQSLMLCQMESTVPVWICSFGQQPGDWFLEHSPWAWSKSFCVLVQFGHVSSMTEAVHCVALWTRTLSQVWTCVKYVPKQRIA